LPHTPTRPSYTLSLHDALPIYLAAVERDAAAGRPVKPGDDPEQRGLAAAGRAEDGDEVIVDDIERGRLQRPSRRIAAARGEGARSEEHTSELQSRENLVCRLLL